MSFDTWYRRATEAFDQETVLLVIFVIASGFAIVETFRFDISRAARFPRLVAPVVLVGSLLLLVSSYLPAKLRRAVEDSTEIFDTDEEFDERRSQAEQRGGQGAAETEGAATEISSVGRPVHDSVFSALLFTAYAIGGYVVGILWVTPLFVAAYGYWFRQSWRRTVPLVVLGFGVAFGFMTVLSVPLDEGQILLTRGVF